MSTTFEASTNVYFTYFCHKIIYYSDNTCIKVASKCFFLIIKLLARMQLHCAVPRNIILLAAHVRDEDCSNYQNTPLCS